MRYKNNISALGFGCMRLPDNFDKSEELILQAIQSGINYFDTAYIYTGKESLLGKILHKNNLREKVKIATKMPLFLCKSYGDFDKIFNKQLARLKTDYIDYYMLHMLNNSDELRGLIDIGLAQWVIDKKQSGKIKQFGFSFHGKGEDFIKLIDFCDWDCNWDFSMIQYNYLDINNQAGLNGLKHAHSKNIPVVIMEPLRGGLLAVHERMPPKAIEIFNHNASMTPAQWALSWLWNHEEVSCVLSGMRNMQELNDNIFAVNNSDIGFMSQEELAMIDNVIGVFKELNTIPCTGCNYCMPCPVGVNIPGCFVSFNAKSLNQYILNTGVMVSKNGCASSCIKCGKCEPRCPQSIPIQESLQIVSRKMEPLWFKLGMPIVRRFTAKKKKR